MSQKLPILERLQADLAVLKHELNVELPKIIEEARDHGDLRENAEYHAAKERQGIINARMGQIEHRIAELSMYSMASIPRDRVGYGSRVELEDLDDETTAIYRIVFPEEVDDAPDSISISSPVAQALLNKSEGDEVVIRLPSSVRRYAGVAVVTIHEDA